MDRVDFIESVNGIIYPEMIVNFFDHFIALKEIVQDSGKVNVISESSNKISFSILFNNIECMNKALSVISNGFIVIYGEQLRLDVEPVSTDLQIILHITKM